MRPTRLPFLWRHKRWLFRSNQSHFLSQPPTFRIFPPHSTVPHQQQTFIAELWARKVSDVRRFLLATIYDSPYFCDFYSCDPVVRMDAVSGGWILCNSYKRLYHWFILLLRRNGTLILFYCSFASELLTLRSDKFPCLFRTNLPICVGFLKKRAILLIFKSLYLDSFLDKSFACW